MGHSRASTMGPPATSLLKTPGSSFFKVMFPFPRHPSAGAHSVIAPCQSSSFWTTTHLLERSGWVKTLKKMLLALDDSTAL